jgi:hypothetical protein
MSESEREDQTGRPETAADGSGTAPKGGGGSRGGGRRSTRRRLLKGAAATAGALAAASYVKPSMRGFGVPEAYAQTGSGPLPPPLLPPPPPTGDCSLKFQITRLRCNETPGRLTGEVCVSRDGGQQSATCTITDVDVFVETQPFGEDCGVPSSPVSTHSSTGGANPLTAPETTGGPGSTDCYTIDLPAAASHRNNKVHIVVSFGNHHDFPGGRVTQVCQTAVC